LAVNNVIAFHLRFRLRSSLLFIVIGTYPFA